jgi:hypothetical protein
MPGKIASLDHRFVRFIPDELEDGTLYVSIEYKTVTHRCCCGCGENVVTPLSPAAWELSFNGQSVSLWPSIAGGRCKSHYIVRRGSVEWARPLTKREEEVALRRDRAAAERLYDGEPARFVGNEIEPAPPTRTPLWWRRLLRYLRKRR